MPSLKELKASALYERQVEDAFRQAQLKEVIPTKQEELLKISGTQELEPLQLQRNITKQLLESLSPPLGIGLINQIIEYIIQDEGNLINFNKFFPSFRTAIKGISFNDIETFKRIYQQFRGQQIGQKLQQQQVSVRLPTMSIQELNKLPRKELNELFKQSLLNATGKKLADIKTITYIKPNGDESDPIELQNINSDDIKLKIKGRANYNNIKIRYIFHEQNPELSMAGDLGVKWTGPTTTGKGLVLEESTPLHSILKKKLPSASTRYL